MASLLFCSSSVYSGMDSNNKEHSKLINMNNMSNINMNNMSNMNNINNMNMNMGINYPIQLSQQQAAQAQAQAHAQYQAQAQLQARMHVQAQQMGYQNYPPIGFPVYYQQQNPNPNPNSNSNSNSNPIYYPPDNKLDPSIPTSSEFNNNTNTNTNLTKLRRGPWSTEEDKHLLELVSLFGGENNLNWVKISQLLESRTAKQARERYHQNLKPSLNRTPITPDEGKLIEELVEKYGKRWAEIARHLNGRSDNAIKNWWNGGANRRKRLNDKNDNKLKTNKNNDNNDDNNNENDTNKTHSRSSSNDYKLPPITTTNNQINLSSPPLSSSSNGLKSLSGLGAANSLLSINNNNGDYESNEYIRKRKIKEDSISKRRHSAASIGSIGSNNSNNSNNFTSILQSPYLNGITSLTSINNNNNINTSIMSPPNSSHIESLTSSPRVRGRSSRNSSICSNELLDNSTNGDRDSSLSRRGSIWAIPSNNNNGTNGSSVGSITNNINSVLRRSSLGFVNNNSRKGSLGGRLSITSLSQYSVSNNNNGNNNSSIGTSLPPAIMVTNSSHSIDEELRKDIFKEGFNISNSKIELNGDKEEGPKGDIEGEVDGEREDEEEGNKSESEANEGELKMKMSISSLVS